MGTEEERSNRDLGESGDMSGSKTKVKVGSEFSEELYVAVGVNQGSVFVTFVVSNRDECCYKKCKTRLNERGFVRR